MRKDTIEKLEKVSNHLKNGVLGHEQFDFSVYNDGNQLHTSVHGCKTNGCAIGEFPFMFPEFEFGVLGVVLKTNSAGTCQEDVKSFLGIDDNEYYHLFIPDWQKDAIYGGAYLDRTATKEQVAANIDAFIEYLNRE